MMINTGMSSDASPPWRKPAPKKMDKVKLTPESIAWARASAKKAGRRYPNLVDNMAAARRQQARPSNERDHP